MPFPSPGDLPNPGIKPRSPALEADALTSEPPGKTIPKKGNGKKKLNYCTTAHISCPSKVMLKILRKTEEQEYFPAHSIRPASLVAQRVKRLPAVQETQVRTPGWEDPLEKEMTTHSSTVAWRIPWTEEPGGLESVGS